MFQASLVCSIPKLLRRHAAARSDKTAFVDATRGLTYGQIDRRTANLAGHLAAMGLAESECAAIHLPNSVDWVEACFAIVRAGGVAVPISTDAPAAEIAYRLADSACRLIVTSGAHFAQIQQIVASSAEPAAILCVEPRDEAAIDFRRLGEVPPPAPPPAPAPPDAPSFIVNTSGTTGKPKGVMLSTRGMTWVTAACWSPLLGLDEEDTLLSPLPLYHSYALNLCVISVLATGAAVHFMERYSSAEALRLLATGSFTIFPGVPTIFHYLAETADEAAVMKGLRACVSAGAILPATFGEAFERRFGVPLLDGYGITETSTMVSMNGVSSDRIAGSCGMPIAGLSVRIVDPASLRDVDPGEEGELIVRGPNVMLGYLRKPEETDKALRNGWYHTGDLARTDRNGFLTITGRIKEVVIRGGQNIAPAEIEEIALQYEAVVDCAVVGLPHEALGEVPGLFVVPRVSGLDVVDLLRHCQNHLSAYKVPTVVQIVEQIPRTGSGKIVRFELREAWEAANVRP